MKANSIHALVWTAVSLATTVSNAENVPPDVTPERVSEMTLEQLMSIPVVSLAGTDQEWFTTPAATYVITGEDIRRSGFLSLAEILRLAPGVFVGQVNSQAFSVGTRGFNGSLANKTLVLIDGRSVYDPLFSGTFWNVQDVLLEDIERIEVIRGPGPTLWGANAMNGVINVITKSARDTQGLFLQGGGGTFERAFASARYGMKVDEHSWIRFYGKWFERDHLILPDGSSSHDDWDMWRGGFRFDREAGDDIIFTLQADAYYSDRIGEFVRNFPVPGQNMVFANDIRDVRNSGGNVLFRLSQEKSSEGWSLQGYYDRTNRVTNVTFEVERNTFDLDWRHRFQIGDRHEILWGLGARTTSDEVQQGVNLIFDPAKRTLNTFSAFVQDTITLVPDRWFAMIGSKFLHNTYTGFEVQPSARLWWTPNDRYTLWTAISRPVRVPSRTERESTLVAAYADTGILGGGPPSGVIVPIGVTGSNVDSEEMVALELGNRIRFGERVTLDATIFYNDYEKLIYVPPAVVGTSWNNNGFGETYGGEIDVTWRVAENWRLVAAYSFVDVQIHGPIFSQDERNTPQHQAQLRSYFDVTEDIELNSGLYYVDNVPGVNAKSYLRLDVGVTWRVTDNFEIAVWGQNLLEPAHPEFSGFEVERGFYLMGTLRF